VNISPAAIAAIRDHVSDWSPDDATILESLNAATVANPSPQPDIAKPVAESTFLTALTDTENQSLGKLLNWVNFGMVKADIEASNRVGIGLWCQVLPMLGLITAGEAAAIAADLSATIPDPSWPALVSWSSIHIGRDLDLSDIAASRPEQ
jgi:hypothetical protein